MLSNLIRSFELKLKYEENCFFPWVMLGPYIKSRGTGGIRMSANADLITMETNVQGKTIENQWLIYGLKSEEKNIILAIWGLLGAFNYLTLSILLSGYPSHPYICTCETRKQSEDNVLVQIPNMTNIILLCFGGSGGGGPGGTLRRSQGYQIFIA